jgi:hypothetical protein
VVARPWESRVPDAIDALVSLLTQAISLAGDSITVHDGAFVGGGTQQDTIIVGWGGFMPGYEYPSRSMSEETGAAAVTGDSVQVGLAPGELETFVINVGSLVRSGSTSQPDVSASRRTAYKNLKYIGQVVQGPKWLNGTVARATIGSTYAYHPVQDRRGLLSVVTCGIRCEAWAQQ